MQESAKKTKALLDATDGSGEALPMGAMGIGEDGVLFRKNSDGVYNFTFGYLGYQFAVRAEATPGSTRMRLHAVLGHLPYTAESKEMRANVLAVVSTAEAALGGRIYVNPQQRVMLLEEFHFDETLTPNSLLTKTVAFLLTAKPYLELLQLLGGATAAAVTLQDEQVLLPAPQY